MKIMNDPVDKQMAIDAINSYFGFNIEEEYGSAVQEVINNLPPAHQKMGRWIEVHGWATPGGDPVWACSECGKGLHVYGIEHGTYGSDIADGQWVACPNCGARMEVDYGTTD